MDIYVEKSDVTWKMATKGLSNITDYNEDGKKSPFPRLLLAF